MIFYSTWAQDYLQNHCAFSFGGLDEGWEFISYNKIRVQKILAD
jgi:hypothetical protein